MGSESRRAVMTLAAGLVFTLGACSKKDRRVDDAGVAAGAGVVAADAGLASPAAGMSDANIFYVLDQSHVLDSAAGAIAVVKGTSSDIREFGQMMVRDSLREQGQDLAKKTGIALVAPVNDAGKAQMARAIAALNAAAKGRDFDKAYIDKEVAYHKALLETATSAMNAAQNAELKNLIQKSAPTILGHLDRAQAIQRQMQ